MPTPTGKFIHRARQLGVTVHTRRDWGARFRTIYGLRRVTRKHAPLPSDTLVQHLTVTHDTGKSHRSFKENMRTVEDIGYTRFGTGVSYNLCIDMVTGEVGIGQSLDAKGAHTLNDKNIPHFSFDQNYVALAFSFIGMPGDTLSDKAVEKTARCIAALIDTGALTKGFDYMPHSAFAYKSCPTDAVTARMDEIRELAIKIHNR